MDSSTLLPLIGIPVVVIGFALRFNPLLVVVVAGLGDGPAGWHGFRYAAGNLWRKVRE